MTPKEFMMSLPSERFYQNAMRQMDARLACPDSDYKAMEQEMLGQLERLTNSPLFRMLWTCSGNDASYAMELAWEDMAQFSLAVQRVVAISYCQLELIAKAAAETGSDDDGDEEDGDVPEEVTQLLTQPRLLEDALRLILSSPVSNLHLAVLYRVLDDFRALRVRGDYSLFVTALYRWGMLPLADGEDARCELKKKADGVKRYMTTRTDHGKERLGLTPGFRAWPSGKNLDLAERMAAELERHYLKYNPR